MSDQKLYLTTLGDLAVRVTGPAGERSLKRGKPAALLVYLACAPGQRASRERLAALLWSDTAPEAARQSLRQASWYIKQRLGDILEATDTSIALVADAVVDRQGFLALADAGAYGDALEQYHGPFLPNFAAPGAELYEDWAMVERRRLASAFVACVGHEVQSAMSAGRFADALRLARRAHDELPLDNAAWRLLLESLIAARDLVGLATELRHLEVLVERGDITLDGATRGVTTAAKRALRGEITHLGSAPPDSHEILAPDLVGREVEFRRLIDAWESAGRGNGSTIVLAGALGVGKSRLLGDFRGRLLAGRSRVAFVRVHEGDRHIPARLAAALAEALAELPGAMGVAPSIASVLVALSPRLADTYTGAVPDTATGDDAFRRKVIAVSELLAAVSEDRPIALLVDDLHWADPESLRIISGLRATIEAEQVMAVFTSALPAQTFEVIGGAETMLLPPLDREGIAEFLARIGQLPTARWVPKLFSHLVASTRGVPRRLIASLRRLLDVGVLRLDDGRWVSDDADALLREVKGSGAPNGPLAARGALEPDWLRTLVTLGRLSSTAAVRDHLSADPRACIGMLESPEAGFPDGNGHATKRGAASEPRCALREFLALNLLDIGDLASLTASLRQPDHADGTLLLQPPQQATIKS